MPVPIIIHFYNTIMDESCAFKSSYVAGWLSVNDGCYLSAYILHFNKLFRLE